jgi:hypothetical protein
MFGDNDYGFVNTFHQRKLGSHGIVSTRKFKPLRADSPEYPEDPKHRFYLSRGLSKPFVFPTPYYFHKSVTSHSKPSGSNVYVPSLREFDSKDIRYPRVNENSVSLDPLWRNRGRSQVEKASSTDLFQLAATIDDRPVRTQAYINSINGLYEYDLNVLMTAVGLKDTVSMVAQAVKDLFALKRALQRGRLKDAAKICGFSSSKRKYVNLASARDMSSRHLEFKFGWQQMAADIASGMEFLTAQEQMPVVSSTGYAFEKVKGGSTLNEYSTSGLPFFAHQRAIHGYAQRNPLKYWDEVDYNVDPLLIQRTRVDYEETVFVRHRRDYVVDSKLLYNMGLLRSTDLALVAWDALPFSFLVDMFVAPVAQYIQALTVPAGLRCFSVSETVTRENYVVGQVPIIRGADRYGKDGSLWQHSDEFFGSKKRDLKVSDCYDRNFITTLASKNMSRNVAFSSNPDEDLKDVSKPGYEDMLSALLHQAFRKDPTVSKLITALEVGLVTTK